MKLGFVLLFAFVSFSAYSEQIDLDQALKTAKTCYFHVNLFSIRDSSFKSNTRNEFIRQASYEGFSVVDVLVTAPNKVIGDGEEFVYDVVLKKTLLKPMTNHPEIAQIALETIAKNLGLNKPGSRRALIFSPSCE